MHQVFGREALELKQQRFPVHLCGLDLAVPQGLSRQTSQHRLALIGWSIKLWQALPVPHGKHSAAVRWA